MPSNISTSILISGNFQFWLRYSQNKGNGRSKKFGAFQFFDRRFAVLAKIGSESPDHFIVTAFDRHAPCTNITQCKRQMAKLSPFIVREKTWRQNDGSGCSRCRTRTDTCIWLKPVDGL